MVDMPEQLDLHGWFGGIDIYIFDQIMKGRFLPGMRILDAGCGHGRNLPWFIRSGCEIFGVDSSKEAIESVREMASQLSDCCPPENFHVEPIEKMSFADASFDGVISNANLHFAKDEPHFNAMLNEMWRVLKPGGVFFARLASSIGIESRIQSLSGRNFRLPDGSTRFLVDEAMLLNWSAKLRGDLIDPIKTTNVQNLRCMTTWVLKKR
jgi:tellurite methyltransferase